MITSAALPSGISGSAASDTGASMKMALQLIQRATASPGTTVAPAPMIRLRMVAPGGAVTAAWLCSRYVGANRRQRAFGLLLGRLRLLEREPRALDLGLGVLALARRPNWDWNRPA